MRKPRFKDKIGGEYPPSRAPLRIPAGRHSRGAKPYRDPINDPRAGAAQLDAHPPLSATCVHHGDIRRHVGG